MNSIIFTAVFILMTTSAFAQTPTKPTATKPAATAKPAATVVPMLQKMKSDALAEKTQLEKLLAEENAKTTGNNVCVTNALSWRLHANEWFLTHFGAFEKLEQDYQNGFQSVVDETNRKWKDLRTSSVATLAVQGQNQQEVPVSFDTMVDYLKNYNSKYAVCTPGQRKDLRKVQNDPHQNKYGIALDQLVVAANKMTANMNASLQETSNQFALKFSEGDCGFAFELIIKSEQNGKTETLTFDILSSATAEITISEQDQWKRLIADHPELDGMPTDGALRLKRFESDARLSSCEQALVGKLPASTLNSPFQTFAKIQAEADYEISMGARSKTGGHSVGSSFASGSWEEITQPQVRAAKLFASSTGSLIAVASDTELYQFDQQTTKWNKKACSDCRLTTGIYDPTLDRFVDAIYQNQFAFRSMLDMNNYFRNHNYAPAVQSVLGSSQGTLYYTAADSHVYSVSNISVADGYSSYAGVNRSTEISNTIAASISTTEDHQLYGIVEGTLVKLNVSQKAWEPVQGAEFETFDADLVQVIAIRSNEIYALTRTGDLFLYANRQWQLIANSSASQRVVQIVANQNGVVYGVTVEGKIVHFNPGE